MADCYSLYYAKGLHKVPFLDSRIESLKTGFKASPNPTSPELWLKVLEILNIDFNW